MKTAEEILKEGWFDVADIPYIKQIQLNAMKESPLITSIIKEKILTELNLASLIKDRMMLDMARKELESISQTTYKYSHEYNFRLLFQRCERLRTAIREAMKGKV